MTKTTQQPCEHQHPTHAPACSQVPGASATKAPASSVLAWPAWVRVAAVLPLVLALWLALWWANEGVALW